MKEQVTDGELHARGYVQHLLTMSCSVFIPFVCRKCGNCCRLIGVPFDYFDLSSIATLLKLGVEQVITTYLGEVLDAKDGHIEYRFTKARLPCPFLTGNLCAIYAVRPDPCRAYPVGTDAGAGGISCPARLEARRAEKALGRGVPYYTTPILRPEDLHNGRQRPVIKKRAWERIKSKYMKTSPSDEALRDFLMINGPCATS